MQPPRNPRSNDSDHAGMPLTRPQHNGRCVFQIHLLKHRLGLLKHFQLNRLPFPISLLQQRRPLRGKDAIFSKKQFQG